jgi:hypothetical protein
MGARRGKPLSRQAGAPENQAEAPQPQPPGSAIYGTEGIYTGYVRSLRQFARSDNL